MRFALLFAFTISTIALAAPSKKVKIIQVAPMHSHHVAKVTHAKKKPAPQPN